VGGAFAFVLELEAAVEAPAGAVVKAVANDQAQREERVLVVDFNPVHLRIVRRPLGRMGLSVGVANDGLEAVERAVEASVDPILRDLTMPAMDGFEATEAPSRRWRSEQRLGPPNVALTAHAMDEHRRRCLDAGTVDSLKQPLQGEELDDVLARLIDVDRAAARRDSGHLARSLVALKEGRRRTAAVSRLVVAAHSLRHHVLCPRLDEHDDAAAEPRTREPRSERAFGTERRFDEDVELLARALVEVP